MIDILAFKIILQLSINLETSVKTGVQNKANSLFLQISLRGETRH